MKSVRIVSADPTGMNTKFEDEDGNEIKGVYKYVLTCSVDRLPSLKLYLRSATVDAIATATIITDESEIPL